MSRSMFFIEFILSSYRCSKPEGQAAEEYFCDNSVPSNKTTVVDVETGRTRAYSISYHSQISSPLPGVAGGSVLSVVVRV